MYNVEAAGGIFTRTVTVGFRSYSTGALPAAWALNTGDQTPRDVSVVTDNVNVATEPGTAVAAPEACWSGGERITTNTHWRLRGSVRIRTGGTTRLGLAPSPVALSVNVVLNTGNIGIEGSTSYSSASIIANRYYRFVLEHVNTDNWFYCDTVNGGTNPTNVPSPDENLPLLFTFTRGINSSLVLYPTISFSAQGNLPDANCIADVTFDDFVLPSSPLPAIPPSFGGGTHLNTPYTYYKSMRESVQIYNNLVISP